MYQVATCRQSWLPQRGVDLHFGVFSPPVSGHLLPQDQGQEGLPIAFKSYLCVSKLPAVLIRDIPGFVFCYLRYHALPVLGLGHAPIYTHISAWEARSGEGKNSTREHLVSWLWHRLLESAEEGFVNRASQQLWLPRLQPPAVTSKLLVKGFPNQRLYLYLGL